MEIFKPRTSVLGWIISTTIPLFIFYLFLLNLRLIKASWGSILGILIMAALFIAAVFFVIIYPSMHYELRDAELYLKCGPICYKIPYSEIKEIVKTNLRYHPTSTGWKLPGYAIGKIYYADRGFVKMCATSMCKNILLIKTEKGCFGITPKDEERFIELLKSRLK